MARPRLEKPEYRLNPNREGYWEVRWTERGRTRSVSTRTRDRSSAEEWLTLFLAGRDNPEPPDNPTIAAILEGYRADREKDGVRSDHTLKNSCNQLGAILGCLLPDHLSQETIRRYATERSLAGRQPGTVLRELGTLRAALHWAKREKWIAAAPEFRMPVRQPAPRDRWLTRQEATALIDACTTPHVRLFVLLALSTGARKEAIAELTWDRVDLSRGIVDFGAGHGNKRRSVVPISGRALDEIRAAFTVRTTDHVLEWGGRPAGDVKIAFGKACRRAGLERVTPHVLRHTAATWMVMAGIELEEVARFLGTTKAMIERVYGKHSPDYLQRAATALRL